MATIDFSIPLWDACKAQTSLDSYEYLKKAQEHSDEAKEDKFSRFQTTAYLLLSVAMTFFQGLAFEAQALGEGALYYFSNETESATNTLTEKGKEGLKTLGFSFYQLFLACMALFNPSEVNSRLTLPKAVELKLGLLSDDHEEITNVLMMQNKALRDQNEFLKRQLGVSPNDLVADLLSTNEASEERLQRANLKAEQDVAFQESLVKDVQKQLGQKSLELAAQKEQDQERIAELEKQLRAHERFWQYFEANLSNEFKARNGEVILAQLKRVREQPHLVENYFRYA